MRLLAVDSGIGLAIRTQLILNTSYKPEGNTLLFIPGMAAHRARHAFLSHFTVFLCYISGHGTLQTCIVIKVNLFEIKEMQRIVKQFIHRLQVLLCFFVNRTTDVHA